MVPEKICPLPWMHSAIRNNGHYRVCCQANTSKSKGLLTDKNDNPVLASSNAVSETRNSAVLKEIRKSMIANNWPESCKRCQMEEDAGVISRRQYEWENWSDLISAEKMTQYTKKDGSINPLDFPVYSLDLRFGNHCNLKCRMCGPTDSNYWYRDYQKLHGSMVFSDTHGLVNIKEAEKSKSAYQWYESSKFWQDLSGLSNEIRYLYMVGGEPLLIKEHLEFLSLLVAENKASAIEIEYNTNLTHISDNILSLWENFKKVKIGVSLDGFGEVNNYIRYPSSFAKIEKNIRFIDEKKLNNIEMWVAPTVQIYNIFDLKNIISWLLESNFKFIAKRSGSPLITTHILHNPEYLNIRSLPKALKELANEELLNLIEDLNIYNNSEVCSLKSRQKTVKRLQGIIKYMNLVDTSDQYEQFLSYSRTLDQIRKQDGSQIFSKLNQYMSMS